MDRFCGIHEWLQYTIEPFGAYLDFGPIREADRS